MHEPRQMDAHKDEHRGDEERQELFVTAQKQTEAGGDESHQHEDKRPLSSGYRSDGRLYSLLGSRTRSVSYFGYF